ncbi:MAG TPA: hypothetical protein VNE58_13715 [Casimicrobiaceae bacterium]|nr:hypothetical protein [Casimicrobiaceae bacterium]
MAIAAAFFGLLAGSLIDASAVTGGSAASLQSAFQKVRADIESNKFGKPLHLNSRQTSNTLSGDVYAIVDHPFERVQRALDDAKNWCNILILHPNVKGCEPDGSAMTVALGRSELPVRFTHDVAASVNDYLDVRVNSPTGPFGTNDYRIRLEATPLDAKRTILHLAYSHDYGLRAKLAMQAYFSTLGRGKVGFTVVDRDAEGKPVYVSDLRGGLERNAMRYYASIEAYVDSLSAPPDQQLERRLRNWYAYTERYPLQLQEEPGYLDAKRREAQKVRAAGNQSRASGAT